MSVGSRHLLSTAAFLGWAIVFASPGAARGQQWETGSHKLWNEKLTPEQIKAALAKLALGGDDKDDPLQKMLREQLGKQYPQLPQEILDAAIKRALSDPRFLERAKQFAKEKQTDPGRPPQLSPDELDRLAKSMPRETDPGKLPPGFKLPNDWKVKPLPKLPANPPVPDDQPPPDVPTPAIPKSKPGPMIEPVPRIDPPGGPMNPPELIPGNPTAPLSVDDSLFRPPDEPSDPRGKSLQAFASIWERNIGSLDQTPEVKRALFDLASGANGLDLDLQDGKGNSIWDVLKNGDGNGLSFGDFDASSGNWKLPKFDFPRMRLGNWFGGSSSSGDGSSSSWWRRGSSSPRPHSSSTSSGTGGLGSFSFGGSWFPVIVLGIVVIGIVLWMVIKNLGSPTPEIAFVGDGIGAWPIDPRCINTREDVVKAFEYLSVLICGASAKTWTHNTIADALEELAATHGETAVQLARLYELARYAPLDEPLTRDELMEARELVCGLAGVSY